MPKITFMGAGSTVFAKNVLGDCMMTPALQDSVIALYDIDSVRLDESAMMLEAINRNNGSRARIVSGRGEPSGCTEGCQLCGECHSGGGI